MTAGGVDWHAHVYGGAKHRFTRPVLRTVGIPGIALPRADGPALLAGHARPVRRGPGVSRRHGERRAFLTLRQVRATLDAHA